MGLFIRFFYEFISVFFDGFVIFFNGFVKGVKQIFSFSSYRKIINNYAPSFGVSHWIFVGVTILLLVLIIFLIGLLIFFAVRRFFRLRRNKYSQEELIEEIADLNAQVEKLMREKEKIMAMKVSQLGLRPGESKEEVIEETEETVDEEIDLTNVRFTKLSKIDYELRNYKIKKYDNHFTLEELIDNFRAFAASKLRLYYSPLLLRAFFGGLASGKLIILQGISGTGKTSLAYAWGKFVKNDSCIASVEPSWRDKTEFLGYFNEFTKKFNETDVLAELYSAGYDDEIHTLVLDEMNIARVEYYFAEMLSILEMPSRSEWIIEIVASSWNDDPKKIVNGKLKIPGNIWYIGTINNDDSTFMVTDKVYDRAMPIDINERIDPFKSREQDAVDLNSSYLEGLFNDAVLKNAVSEKTLDKISDMDSYVITHFRIAFGNRIMKQLKIFVPVYVACGGTEIEGVDYFIAKKILRKFDQLNISFIRDEINPFIAYLNKEFGKDAMRECIAYMELLRKQI